MNSCYITVVGLLSGRSEKVQLAGGHTSDAIEPAIRSVLDIPIPRTTGGVLMLHAPPLLRRAPAVPDTCARAPAPGQGTGTGQAQANRPSAASAQPKAMPGEVVTLLRYRECNTPGSLSQLQQGSVLYAWDLSSTGHGPWHPPASVAIGTGTPAAWASVLPGPGAGPADGRAGAAGPVHGVMEPHIVLKNMREGGKALIQHVTQCLDSIDRQVPGEEEAGRDTPSLGHKKEVADTLRKVADDRVIMETLQAKRLEPHHAAAWPQIVQDAADLAAAARASVRHGHGHGHVQSGQPPPRQSPADLFRISPLPRQGGSQAGAAIDVGQQEAGQETGEAWVTLSDGAPSPEPSSSPSPASASATVIASQAPRVHESPTLWDALLYRMDPSTLQDACRALEAVAGRIYPCSALQHVRDAMKDLSLLCCTQSEQGKTATAGQVEEAVLGLWDARVTLYHAIEKSDGAYDSLSTEAGTAAAHRLVQSARSLPSRYDAWCAEERRRRAWEACRDATIAAMQRQLDAEYHAEAQQRETWDSAPLTLGVAEALALLPPVLGTAVLTTPPPMVRVTVEGHQGPPQQIHKTKAAALRPGQSPPRGGALPHPHGTVALDAPQLPAIAEILRLEEVRAQAWALLAELDTRLHCLPGRAQPTLAVLASTSISSLAPVQGAGGEQGVAGGGARAALSPGQSGASFHTNCPGNVHAQHSSGSVYPAGLVHSPVGLVASLLTGAQAAIARVEQSCVGSTRTRDRGSVGEDEGWQGQGGHGRQATGGTGGMATGVMGYSPVPLSSPCGVPPVVVSGGGARAGADAKQGERGSREGLTDASSLLSFATASAKHGGSKARSNKSRHSHSHRLISSTPDAPCPCHAFHDATADMLWSAVDAIRCINVAMEQEVAGGAGATSGVPCGCPPSSDGCGRNPACEPAALSVCRSIQARMQHGPLRQLLCNAAQEVELATVEAHRAVYAAEGRPSASQVAPRLLLATRALGAELHRLLHQGSCHGVREV